MFYIWIHRQQEERETLGLDWIFETPKPNGTLSPTRPHFVIVSLPITWMLVHTYNPCTEEVEIGGLLEFVGQPAQVPGQARTSCRRKVVLDEWVTLEDCSLAFRMPAYTQKRHIKLETWGCWPCAAEMTEEWRSQDGPGRVRAVGGCCNGAAVEPCSCQLRLICDLS